MAILKIARMGHPVLRAPAAVVEDPGAPEIRRLVQDMIETLDDAGGTGLAAPQVYVPKRVVLLLVSDARARAEEERDDDAQEEGEEEGQDTGDDENDDDEGVPLTVLIDPEIEPLGDEVKLGWEACLSVPGLAGEVPRYRSIRYRGFGLDSAEIVREAHGYHARVVQHECDHLDGLLYPDRMTDLSRLAFTSELKHLMDQESADEIVEE